MTSGEASPGVRHVTCTLCEAMCSLEVHLDDDGAISSLRGHEADPLSRGHLCPKAFALEDLHDDPDRLRRPVRRTPDGGWREGRGTRRSSSRHPGSWPFSASTATTRSRSTRATPTSTTSGADPQAHARAAAAHAQPVLGHVGRPAPAPARRLGALRAPVPDPGARHRPHRACSCCSAHNPMARNGSIMTVPDFPGRLRELTARGGRMVVFDPRRTETAKVADEHHFVRPGTDVLVLLAMLRDAVRRRRRHAPPPTSTASTRCVTAVADFTPEARRARQPRARGRDPRLAREIAAAPRRRSTGGSASRRRRSARCASGRSTRSTS